jgi:hypothetical protein
MRKVFFASICGFVGIVLLRCGTVAGGVIVETGFNDSRGLHGDELAGFPYRLNETAIGQGEAEPGWTSPWEGSASMATVQDLVTFEGDGALLIQPTSNTSRQWSEKQGFYFVLEQWLRFTTGSQTVVYIVSAGPEPIETRTGPQFIARSDGKFIVVDGEGDGCSVCTTEDTGLEWTPDEWYKVTLLVDVSGMAWRFLVDDLEYAAPDPLGFRAAVSFFDGVNYLTELSGSGAYADSLRVLTERPPSFRRGDVNADGALNIGDPANVLHYLFGPGELTCEQSADTNDDGRLDVSDPIALLGYLFLGTSQPAEPFLACARDPTPDDLECAAYPGCAP